MKLLDRTETPLDLVSAASAAYHESLARTKRDQEQERRRLLGAADSRIVERTRRLVESLTGCRALLAPGDIDGPLIRVGSLWLTAAQDERGEWRLVLVTRCEHCRAVLYRDRFDDKRELGRLLAVAAVERDTVCTFCRPENLSYLRSFDLDAEGAGA